MFFVDGETAPSINGTGSEDYFLGARDFANHRFSYGLFGVPFRRCLHSQNIFRGSTTWEGWGMRGNETCGPGIHVRARSK